MPAEGVPRLRRLADARGVRFTFFVTMGRVAHIGLALRHRYSRGRAQQAPRLSVARKLGLLGLLETICFNPHVGRRHREEIDALVEDGHEVGLHGGVNHAVWQRTAHSLDAAQLEALLRPAYDEFAGRYGPPKGFSAPGFEWNDRVLDMLDREGFLYASDMEGEQPFRPSNGCGVPHLHYQVPVNVIGRGRVPVVEQGLARGRDATSIAEEAVAQIRSRRFALMYDHPYVAGPSAEVLDKIIERVEGDYDIVTVEEYLAEWRRRHE